MELDNLNFKESLQDIFQLTSLLLHHLNFEKDNYSRMLVYTKLFLCPTRSMHFKAF